MGNENKKNAYPTVFDIKSERLLDKINESSAAQLLYDLKCDIATAFNKRYVSIEDSVKIEAEIKALREKLKYILERRTLRPEDREIIQRLLGELSKLEKDLSDRTNACSQVLKESYRLQQENNTLDALIEKYNDVTEEIVQEVDNENDKDENDNEEYEYEL